jgi:hypothetical protein
MATVRQSHINQPPVLPAAPQIEHLDLMRLVGSGLKRAVWLTYDFLIPVGIIAGFFWLQIQINHGMDGVAASITTIISVVFELGLMLVWSLLRDHVRLSCLG